MTCQNFDWKHPPIQDAVNQFVKKHKLTYTTDENCWIIDLG